MEESIEIRINNTYTRLCDVYTFFASGEHFKTKKFDYGTLGQYKIILEFDQFKKEFPDSYKNYLNHYLSGYLFLQKEIERDVISSEQMAKLRPTVEPLLKHAGESIENMEYMMNQLFMPICYFSAVISNIILYLKEMLNPKNEPELQTKLTAKPIKGKSELNREQTALLFFYLRENQLITQPTNENLAMAISLITGYSSKQMQDILKAPGTDSNNLGKDNNGMKREDYKSIISQLEKLIDRIKRDYKTYSDKGELK